MKTKLTPIWSSKFTYLGSTKTFVAEISDLKPFNPLTRLYDAAMDVGFTMRSKITGIDVDYFLTEEHKDAEGDVTSWEFRPTVESERKTVDCRGTSVTIFND